MSTASQADQPDNIYGWGIVNGSLANTYQIPTNPRKNAWFLLDLHLQDDL
jgi:hypothetical protein